MLMPKSCLASSHAEIFRPARNSHRTRGSILIEWTICRHSKKMSSLQVFILMPFGLQ